MLRNTFSPNQLSSYYIPNSTPQQPTSQVVTAHSDLNNSKNISHINSLSSLYQQPHMMHDRNTLTQQQTPQSLFPSPSQCNIQQQLSNIQTQPQSLSPTDYTNDYLEAKRCELLEKDLDKAVFFYKKCLSQNLKRDSALKDLATVYHKQGKTQIALDLLQKEKENYFGDQKSFDNLISTLEKQLVPTGKVYLRFIMIYNLHHTPVSQAQITKLFPQSAKKQKQIIYFDDLSLLTPSQTESRICLLEFNSYSNAKKVIENSSVSSAASNTTQCYLVDIMGKVKVHIQNSLHFDRDLVEYQNSYLKPSTFCESVMLLSKDIFSSDLMNSDDKKYTWLHDLVHFQKHGPLPFVRDSKKLENQYNMLYLLDQKCKSELQMSFNKCYPSNFSS